METVENVGEVVKNEGTAVESNILVTDVPAVGGSVRKQVSALEFARIFNSCSNAKEVSEKTGLPVASVHTKATGLRKNGVTLKNFPRGGGKGRAKLDYAAINAALAADAAPAADVPADAPTA